MKKTLVALAVTAVAASASATTVYNQDGTKVDVSGSVQIKLGKFGKDQRSDLRNDDSRLMVDAEHDLGNGLKALAGVQFRFDADSAEDNTFNNPTTYHLFAGFSHADVGTVTFGKQDTTLDGVQLSDFTYWGGNNNLRDYADKSIKFQSAEWSGFSFGLDYIFGDSSKARVVPTDPSKVATKLKYGYGVSAFYNRELAQDLSLSLAAGYGVDRSDSTATTNTVLKNRAWRTSAQLAYGPVTFGAEYGQNVVKAASVKAKVNTLLVSTKYQIIEPSTVYVQWQRTSNKDTKFTSNTYIAGVDYKFNKNVLAFVEYGRSSQKSAKHENQYGAGLRVFF